MGLSRLLVLGSGARRVRVDGVHTFSAIRIYLGLVLLLFKHPPLACLLLLPRIFTLLVVTAIMSAERTWLEVSNPVARRLRR